MADVHNGRIGEIEKIIISPGMIKVCQARFGTFG